MKYINKYFFNNVIYSVCGKCFEFGSCCYDCKRFIPFDILKEFSDTLPLFNKHIILPEKFYSIFNTHGIII